MMTSNPHGYTKELADALFGEGNWSYDAEGFPASLQQLKEQREAIERYRATFPLPFDPTKYPQVVVLFGTGSDMDGGSEFGDLFFKKI